ncbi:hypothetical protein SUGI_1201430 [Cryptomeria japonica]|nr:hypothetical protein SUGI_1201430 [Cryptomeria japonica]
MEKDDLLDLPKDNGAIDSMPDKPETIVLITGWRPFYHVSQALFDLEPFWFTLPGLPYEFNDFRILKNIGNAFGKFVRIDRLISNDTLVTKICVFLSPSSVVPIVCKLDSPFGPWRQFLVKDSPVWHKAKVSIDGDLFRKFCNPSLSSSFLAERQQDLESLHPHGSSPPHTSSFSFSIPPIPPLLPSYEVSSLPMPLSSPPPQSHQPFSSTAPPSDVFFKPTSTIASPLEMHQPIHQSNPLSSPPCSSSFSFDVPSILLHSSISEVSPRIAHARILSAIGSSPSTSLLLVSSLAPQAYCITHLFSSPSTSLNAPSPPLLKLHSSHHASSSLISPPTFASMSPPSTLLTSAPSNSYPPLTNSHQPSSPPIPPTAQTTTNLLFPPLSENFQTTDITDNLLVMDH